MKASRVGILSAIVASSCCLLPIVLVLLGLGSLGIGSVLGRFHWTFVGVAFVLLSYAWWRYLTEQRRCQTAHCAMEQGQTTRLTLVIASLIVVLFVGVNLSTYASQRSGQPPRGATRGLTQAVIPVEGMTCFTCELTVESSLKRLKGVAYADAKVADHAVYVSYNPAQVNLDDLITAIKHTGYQARQPQ